jgi:hypothetical protein
MVVEVVMVMTYSSTDNDSNDGDQMVVARPQIHTSNSSIYCTMFLTRFFAVFSI